MNQKEILDSVQKYFQEIEFIHTVIVYGSVAEDQFRESSDVDIAIAADHDQRNYLKEHLRESCRAFNPGNRLWKCNTKG